MAGQTKFVRTRMHVVDMDELPASSITNCARISPWMWARQLLRFPIRIGTPACGERHGAFPFESDHWTCTGSTMPRTWVPCSRQSLPDDAGPLRQMPMSLRLEAEQSCIPCLAFSLHESRCYRVLRNGQQRIRYLLRITSIKTSRLLADLVWGLVSM